MGVGVQLLGWQQWKPFTPNPEGRRGGVVSWNQGEPQLWATGPEKRCGWRETGHCQLGVGGENTPTFSLPTLQGRRVPPIGASRWLNPTTAKGEEAQVLVSMEVSFGGVTQSG